MLLGTAILAIAACQSTPPPPEPKPRPEPAIQQAAAQAAERSARASLREAEQLLAADDPVGATAAYSLTDRSALSANDRARAALIGAELAWRSKDIPTARALLADITKPDATTALLAAALTAALDGRTDDGARELMNAAIDDATRPRVHDLLWSLLQETDLFLALEESERGTPVERGWWQLRLAAAISINSADRTARVDRWTDSHPDHPAARDLPRVLQLLPDPGPTRIALLLPDSGPLAAAGRAIRDGFMAAWLELAPETRPHVTFYDTESGDIGLVYAAARAKGADLVIGPLQRDQVAALNGLGPELPVLALNNLGDTPPAPSLHQFGLAPEDEMISLAAWLTDSGRERILVLRGPHEWALRLERALTDAGQKPVGSYLIPELRTVTDTVGTAMLITASEARHAELEQLTGLPLAFAPRARQDVDAIVTLVDGLEITALVPSLKFHYANDVPAFAPALTLQEASPGALSAMEGFHVVELPWILPGIRARDDLLEAFTPRSGSLASLYAFGADALRLADRVWRDQRGGRSRTLGFTGSLVLNEDGRVHRTLARMRIEGGQAVPERTPSATSSGQTTTPGAARPARKTGVTASSSRSQR
ncbi:MAG: penicillin-binding protein activator [Pseudomonadales bacterium]